MKVFFRNIFLLVLLAAVIHGCADTLDDVCDPGMEITLGSRLTSSQVSKAAISTDYSGEPLSISYIRWDEGNEVFPAGIPVGSASLDGIPDAQNGWIRDISCSNPEYYLDRTSEVGFVGIYPDQSKWSEGFTDSQLSSGRTLSYKIDGETDVMVSDFAKGNFSTKVSPLVFRHALCQFRIYAYAVNEEIRDEWGNLKSIALNNLPENVQVVLPSDSNEDPSFSYTGGPEPGGMKRTFAGKGIVMSVEIPEPGSDEPAVVLLAGVPYGETGNSSTSVLGISAVTANYQGENSVSIARNFRPGYTYNIFLRFSSVGIIDADVSVGEWEFGGEYEIEETFTLYSDLSRYGTANSYVVSSGNMGYSFDATVKGNGVNSLSGRSGETYRLPDISAEISPLPVDVRVLKSDALMKRNGDSFEPVPPDERTTVPVIDESSLKITGGTVLFKVPGVPAQDGLPARDDDYRLNVKGNVLLGVFASEDDDEPLWSWHIWVTDPPQNQGYLNGYVAMDRNLGAVSSNPEDFDEGESFCTGLYYQWGRKDPMMIRDGELMNTVSGTPVPVVEAHRNPTVYYHDISGGYDWTTEDSEVKDHLWGYISSRDDIKKTLYDPCPPGYRVSGNPIWQDQSEAVIPEDLKEKGYNFTIGGSTKVYYPASKCIVGGVVCDSDSEEKESQADGYAYVYQLSATPYEPEYHSDKGADGLAYHFRYNYGVAGPIDSPQPDYNAMVPDFTDTGQKYSTQRSSAYPVRCVFEDSAPVVNDLSASQTANCYVVRKTGFYSFKANVRGNGTTVISAFEADGKTERYNIDGGAGATITGVDHVDILWWQGDISDDSSFMKFAAGRPSSGAIAEACPIVMMDGGEPDFDGNVMFYARIDGESDYGNVGLAAYNAVGDILWTWHLWIQPYLKVQRVGQYSMIDRNLGATYTPENESGGLNDSNCKATYGFYYQWGRKDPFFGTDTYWFEKEDGEWDWQNKVKTSPASSINESFENPLTYNTSVTGNKYWQTTYWPGGNESGSGSGEVNHLWGYAGSTQSGLAFVKTMHDPCPPGYRVMQYDVFMTANICYTEEYEGIYFETYGQEAPYYYYGMMLNSGDRFGGEIREDWLTTLWEPGELVVDNGIWLPNAGYINASGEYSNNDDGSFGYLSTSTPMTGKTCREIVWERNGYTEGWRPTYYYSIQQRNSDAYTANGRPVRCQME